MKHLKWFLLGGFTVAILFLALYGYSSHLQVQAATSPVTPVYGGGTGTSTVPSKGQILVGQANGTYGPQATSTLGFSGGSGTPANGLPGQYLGNTATNTPAWSNLPIVTVCPFGVNGCTYKVSSSTAAQITINQALSTGSNRVHITAGQYTVSGSIIPIGSQVIQGDGIEATHITENNGSQVDIIAASSTAASQTDFVLIEDLTADCNYANNTSGSDTAINMYQALGWVIDNVHANHCLRGVWINGTSGNFALNNTVENSREENTQNESIVLGAYAPDNKVYNNNTGPSTAYSCIGVQNDEEQILMNHQATCGGAGSGANGILVNQAGNDNMIIGNFDEHAQGSGILIASGMQGNTVVGETSFDNCQNNNPYCGGFEDAGIQTTITNDKSYDDQGSKTQDYAMVIDPTATSSIYSENSFQSGSELTGGTLASSTPTQSAAQTLSHNVILTQNYGYSTYGTTTPLQATFGISGGAGITPFTITSSTGATLFNLYQNGDLYLNGFRYTFPTNQPQPGNFLGVTASGTSNSLLWNNPLSIITVGASGYNYIATGTNDQIGIQAALNFASTSPISKVVYITPGSYSIATGTQLSMPSNVTLMCAGDATNIVRAATSTDMIFFNGVSNSSIQNCLLSDAKNAGSLAINGAALVKIQNSNNIKSDKVDMSNVNGFGYYIPSTASSSDTNITITNGYLQCNGFQDCIGGGPTVQGNSTTSDVTISDMHIYQTLSGGTNGGNEDNNCFDITGGFDITVTNVQCWGTMQFGFEKVPNSNSIFANNIIHPSLGTTKAAGELLVLQTHNTQVPASSTPIGLILNGNTITGGDIQMVGNATSSITSAIVTNNNVTEAPNGYAVNDVLALNGLYFNYFNNGTVANNQVYSATGTIISGTTGIQFTANTSGNNSSGNTVQGFANGLDGGNVASNVFNGNYPSNNTNNYANTQSVFGLNTSGRFSIGTGADFGEELTILSSNASVGYFGSNGHNNANVLIDTNGGPLFNTASLIFDDAGNTIWTIKGHDNSENFAIASSSGTSVLTITPAQNIGIGTSTPNVPLVVVGSTTLTSLGAGCVNSTASGALYVATCAASGSGNSAWTIGPSLIYNATSTNVVDIGTSTPTNATLTIQGSSAQTANLLNIASSSGASILSVAAAPITSFTIGTSTTAQLATLFVQGSTASTTMPLFTIASSSGANYYLIDSSGHQWTGGTAPTCGAGCASVTGDDSDFRAVTGSGVTAVTINFANVWKTPAGVNISPACVGSDESGGTTTSDPSSTPSSVTVNLSASLTSKNLAIQCRGSLNFTQ